MRRLIGRLRRRARARAFSAPIDTDGHLVYAVGDVHGRHELLARLVERILADAAALGVPPRIVFLGDYIDRGEGAREAIELLSGLAGQDGAECVFLMGNHEQMLLRFLREPSSGGRWLRYGGLQTLMSYGVTEAASLRAPDGAAAAAAALAEALGPHLRFLESLRLSHQAGNVFFAHAGADPALPTEEQAVDTLLWGCERFRTAERQDGIWVAHGHFVVARPTATGGRISVDTGACFSGRLTAARIAGGEVSFLEG